MVLVSYYWQKVFTKIKNQLFHILWRIRSLNSEEILTDDDFLSEIHTQFESKEKFHKHILNRKNPTFFISKQKEQIVQLILSEFPEYMDSTIQAADLIGKHIFDLLGSTPKYLGSDIDWHSDFISGHRWKENQYFSKVKPAAYPGGYDIKIPWELNRCQHFIWLGQAYWFTNDERYSKEFVLEIKSWIQENPYPWGVNWVTSMEVAIRAINWLWGFYYFKDSPTLTEDFAITFFKCLLIHGRHIFNNLEIQVTKQGKLKSNHYLSNIVGLTYLGLLLPEFKEADHWREFGLRELESEILTQVNPDGVNFEASISYHRLVTELFIVCVLLAQLNGHTFSEIFLSRVEKMIEFIMDITKPDGTVPMIGDNDNGRVHRLKVWNGSNLEWVDFRYLLAIGSVVFDRMDFALAAGDQWEEAFWLCGKAAYNKWMSVQETSTTNQLIRSAAYSDAGIYIMRDNDAYMVVDAGNNGQKGLGGHAHNDVFSFELYSDQTHWIIDSGTYTYTSDYLKRNYFRTTSSHNSVMIDNLEQNSLNPKSPFWLGDECNPKVEKWISEELYDFLGAQHYGYNRGSNPVTHHRRYYFNKSISKWWIIQDYFEGIGLHDFIWSFHIANHEIDYSDFGIILRNQQKLELAILFLDEKPDVYIESGWNSPSYGVKSKIPVVRAKLRAEVPLKVTFLIHPLNENAGITSIRQTAQKKIVRACESFMDIQFIP